MLYPGATSRGRERPSKAPLTPGEGNQQERGGREPRKWGGGEQLPRKVQPLFGGVAGGGQLVIDIYLPEQHTGNGFPNSPFERMHSPSNP